MVEELGFETICKLFPLSEPAPYEGDVLKHQSGKHDQKLHGSWAGENILPENWKAKSRDEVETMLISDFMSSYSGRDIDRFKDQIEQQGRDRAAITTIIDGPKNMRFTIESETPVDNARVNEALSEFNRLQEQFPTSKLGVQVMVSDRPFRDEQIDAPAFVMRGEAKINMRPEFFQSGERLMDADDGHFMPVAKEVSELRYVITHEYGHVMDRRSQSAAVNDVYELHKINATTSAYGAQNPFEDYAEAFTEYSLTNGKTTNAAAQYYAKRYFWSENMEKAADSFEDVLIVDTFSDKKPPSVLPNTLVTESLMINVDKGSVVQFVPEDVIIRFAPGLVPVLKHAVHEQKTHGNWARGSSDEGARSILEYIINGTSLDRDLMFSSRASVVERITDRMSDVSTEDLISASGLGSSDSMNMNSFGQSLSENQKDTIKLALTENDNIVVRFGRGTVLQAYDRDDIPWEDIFSGPADSLGRAGVPAGSAEAEKFVREWATSQMVARWTLTSNGQDERALALQDAVAKEFKVKDASGWDVKNPTGVEAILKKDGATLQRFARAQYEETQSIFRDIGVSEVEVFRGKTVDRTSAVAEAAMRGVGANGTDISVQTRPLSSWSTNADTAREFAVMNMDDDNAYRNNRPVLLRSTVPVSSILATGASGMGSLGEREMITVGSGFGSRIVALMDSSDEGFDD